MLLSPLGLPLHSQPPAPAMASIAPFSLLLLLLLLGLSSTTAKKTYIVHMKHHDRPSFYPTAHDWYSANLHSLPPSSASHSLLYANNSAYNVFAASLDASEADALAGSDSVLGVYEDTVYTLHTAQTPEFLEKRWHDVADQKNMKKYECRAPRVGKSRSSSASTKETQQGTYGHTLDWVEEKGIPQLFVLVVLDNEIFLDSLTAHPIPILHYEPLRFLCQSWVAASFNTTHLSRILFVNKIKAAAASAETAHKEEIKAQADVMIDEEGNVSNTSIELEESDEENEGQVANKKKGRLLGMAVEAFWLLIEVALRIIKGSKIVLNYGDFKFEIPLRVLWGDGA